MRILLVNDDGFDAPGIRALAKAFTAAHEVIMIAPESERSAFSHSISIHNDIAYSLRKESFEAYSISGTPADCVKLGVLHILKDRRPDLVLSGINNGSNLGSDIMYSGTVSAALEGAYLQIPSIAVSLSDWNCGAEVYDRAARYVYDHFEKLISFGLDVETVLNINYPAHTKPIGTRITKIGYNIYDDAFVETEAGVRIKGRPIEHGRNAADCDVELCKAGYVTISPVALDRNDYKALEKMKASGIF